MPSDTAGRQFAAGDRIQVRQSTHPDALQRKLLSAMGVTLQVDQQIDRWSDGVESQM